MTKSIFFLGISHHQADIEVREKFALSKEQIPQLLGFLAAGKEVTEAVILSTCNRTEFYFVADDGIQIIEQIKTNLRQLKKNLSGDDLQLMNHLVNEDAVRHLLTVAAGLDSQMLGENQILSQVKEFFEIAAMAKTTGALMNKLFNLAIKAGKRVRAETKMTEGAVSVAFAAVELSRKVFSDLNKRSILICGAGETAELTASFLKQKGFHKIYVANRTFKNAQTLAAKVQGEAVAMEDISEVLIECDLVIGSMISETYVIHAEMIEKALRMRKNASLFLIDISVPRIFDPAINKFDDVFLHDIDDLNKIIEQNIHRRRAEIPQAEKIIDEEFLEFQQYVSFLKVKPVVESLKERFIMIGMRQLKKSALHLSEKEEEKFNHILKDTITSFLKDPVVHLKQNTIPGEDMDSKLNTIRDIFLNGKPKKEGANELK